MPWNLFGRHAHTTFSSTALTMHGVVLCICRLVKSPSRGRKLELPGQVAVRDVRSMERTIQQVLISKLPTLGGPSRYWSRRY
jgi:hypothetical protein